MCFQVSSCEWFLWKTEWTSSFLFQDCLLTVQKTEFWKKREAALGASSCLLPHGWGKRICQEHLKPGCQKEQRSFIRAVRLSRSWRNVVEIWTLHQRTMCISKVPAILKHLCATLSYRKRNLIGIMHFCIIFSLYFIVSVFYIWELLLWWSSSFALWYMSAQYSATKR